MKIFLLSKQDLELSKAELLAVLDTKKYKQEGEFIILETSFKNYQRLAYTKSVYQLLFTTNKSRLEKDIEKYPWNRIYKENFCVRQFNTGISEKKFGSLIWEKIKNPKVKLKNAKTEIHFFRHNSKIFCCNLIKVIKSDYEERKPHKRPELHPSSLHPRLARAVINLTGIKKGILLDPFCGSGGILLEAGLIGLKPVGYDIDPVMIRRAKINLKHYKIKAQLEMKDSTLLKKPVNYVVTDLPYGRNTPSKNLEDIYKDFIAALKKILKKKAVIMFPDFIDHKRLLKGFKIEKEFTYYLHKSLSKNIILIKK